MIRIPMENEKAIHALLVLIVALLCYANTVGNGFVWTDRTAVVEGEARLHSAGDLAGAFLSPDRVFKGEPLPGAGGYYRPVTAISYTIDHALFGENPAGYHLVNIALHGLTTLFFFLFLGRLLRNSSLPLLAALLFAAHPIHTEAVAWIGARASLLAAIGVMLSLYLYAGAERRPGWIAGSLAVFVFALFAKESAASLPLLIVIARPLLRRSGERFFSWSREAPYFALLLFYILIRLFALGGIGAGSGGSIEPAFLVPTMVRVLGGYLRLLLLPWPLHTNDAVRISTFLFDARAFLALLFIGAVLYALLRLGRGGREVPFGLAWLGVTLIPVLNIVPLLHFRAERFLYLPSAGFLIAVAFLLDLWGPWFAGREKRFGLTAGEITTALVVLVLAFGTVARNRTWKSDTTLFSDTLAKNRYAPEANYQLGADAYRNGGYTEAIHLFRVALDLDPGWAAWLPVTRVLADLGFAHQKAGDPASAEPVFRKVLQMSPAMEKAEFGLALSCGALDRHEEALGLYRGILRENPAHRDAIYNLALEYEALDSLARAEEEYRRLIRIDPDRKEAHLNLGSLLARRNLFPEALDEYRAALRLSPRDPKIHFNLGLLFARAGEKEGAIEAFQSVLELDPDHGDARELLDLLAPSDTAGVADSLNN